jgi:hypothetical protein
MKKRHPRSRCDVAKVAAVVLLAACGQQADTRPADPAPATPSSALTAPTSAAAPPLIDPNPFKLPSTTLKLDKGGRVFTVSEQMLAGARIGSTLVLHAEIVVGFDGELLIVDNRNGPSYKIHPAYAIAVPDDAAVRPGDPVVTEHHGVLRHAVVKKHVKDRVTVRFTSGDSRIAEMVVKSTRFIRQSDGLRPGNFAALGDGETLRHVLLVSTFEDGGEKKWLVLGAGSAASIAPERSLEPIPVKYQPRAGTAVLAEHNGVLRRATVASIPEPGIFTVKYERAGRPATLGWGFLLPQAQPKPPSK